MADPNIAAPPIQQPPAPPISAPPATGGTSDNIDFAALLRQLQQNSAQYRAATAPMTAQAMKIASEPTPIPQAPALSPLPQAPNTASIVDPMRQMSPLLLFLSLAGGALTGAPLTGAFKAGAAYINGIKQGQMQKAQLAQQDFNSKLHQAIETNTEKLQQYRDILESTNISIADKSNKLRAVAIANGDEQTAALLDQGNIQVAVQAMEAQTRAQEMLLMKQQAQQLANERLVASSFSSPQMVTTKDGRQVLAQQDKAGVLGKAGQWYTADANRTRVDDIVASVSPTTAGNPELQDSMVDLIGTYRAAPLTGWALRTASGQQIMGAVAKKYPQYNANAYPVIGRVMQAFATGTQGTRLTSINVAIQHLNVMRQLAKALDSGDVRAINAARQEWEKQFGSAAPTNFDAIKQIIGQEVVKAIVNSGGGVTERQQAEGTFNRVASPQQLSGAIDSVEALLAGQVAGLKNQYDTQTRGTPGVLPFDDLLLPETKAALGSVPALINSASGGVVAPATPTRSKW